MRSAFDDAEIGEGDAKQLVRYFLEGEAERLFKGLGSRDRNSYPRILRWLLRTYVRDTMPQDARESFLTRVQKSSETELEYSKEARALARRCGGIIPEREVIHRFVRGLQPGIRTQVQIQVTRKTTWPIVVALAADFGNSLRDASKASKAPDESRLLSSNRRRSSETGWALVARPAQIHRAETSSDGEESLQLQSLDVPEDGATVAALPAGRPSFNRTPSYYSISSRAGSSDSFQTARGMFPPPSATYVPQRESRKVMLPPGVPFPARQPSTNSKQTCWGCGLEGHFLSDCPTTDPRLIKIALEGFRARKRKRMTKITPVPPMAPPLPDRRSFSAVDGPVRPRAMTRPTATQPRAMVAQRVEPTPAEGSENPSAVKNESL